MTPLIDSDDDGAVLRAIGIVRAVITEDNEHLLAVVKLAAEDDDPRSRMRTFGALALVAAKAVTARTADLAEADRLLAAIQHLLVRGDG
jgi:hypothetical protein